MYGQCRLYVIVIALYILDKNSIDVITKNRMQHADFEVVKVIGRGAFGEVQLVSLIRILHECQV